MGSWLKESGLWQMQLDAYLTLVWLCLESGDSAPRWKYAHKVLREDRCQEVSASSAIARVCRHWQSRSDQAAI